MKIKSVWRLVFIGIVCTIAAFLVAFISVYSHGRHRSMTIQEALWVCTKDMKTYYPPGSPESLQIIERLAQAKTIDIAKFRTDEYLCYRLGMEDVRDIAPLLWEIDPSTLRTQGVPQVSPRAK